MKEHKAFIFMRDKDKFSESTFSLTRKQCREYCLEVFCGEESYKAECDDGGKIVAIVFKLKEKVKKVCQ